VTSHPLVAKCGLNCAVCSIHRAPLTSRQDWLERAATRFRCRPDDIFCDGCGGPIERRWTDGSCKVIACQTERGHDYCQGCAEFPCERLTDFAPENLRRVHEIGVDAFFEEDTRLYTCRQCGAPALRSDETCHRCGTAMPR
jgi:hypothetical protein